MVNKANTYYYEWDGKPMYMLTLYCRECGREVSFPITPEEREGLTKPNRVIQNILPHHTAAQREMIISRTCGDCWDKMFKEANK